VCCDSAVMCHHALEHLLREAALMAPGKGHWYPCVLQFNSTSRYSLCDLQQILIFPSTEGWRKGDFPVSGGTGYLY